MHSFPRRFRAQRSSEIEATFHEAVLAGERGAYGPAALVDVVVAGWAERARTRPPLGPYLRYRLLGGQLQRRWHGWMFDDLDGWFRLRRAAWLGVPVGFMLGAVWRVSHSTIGPPPLFWSVWVAAMVLGAGLERRRTLTRHGYDSRTRSWMPPVVVVQQAPGPRRIRRAAPTLTGTAAALLVVAPFAAVALLLPAYTVRSVTIGSFSLERIVDHTAAVGWAAIAAGCIGLSAGVAKHRWIATRTLVPANSVDTTAFVVEPNGPSPRIASIAVLVAGIATSLLPIAPLVVPAAFLAAGCLSPFLLVLAHTARRLERSGSVRVGLSIASQVDHASRRTRWTH